MSRENEERLRRAYEALSSGDFDSAMEIAHPEIEFVRTGGQSRIQGAKEVRAWMEPDAFEDVRMEPLEFRTHGDKVLVRSRNRARGIASGLEIDSEVWAVWTLDEKGLATRIEGFLMRSRRPLKPPGCRSGENECFGRKATKSLLGCTCSAE